MEQKDIKQERKEKILAFIESPEYMPLKRKEMREILSVQKKDRPMFDEILEELMQEGLLLETLKGKLLCPKRQNMGIGSFIGHAKGFGFVTPEDGGEDIFIPVNETGGAMQKDRVLYKVLYPAAEDKKLNGTGVVVRILERGMHQLVGLYEQSGSFGFVAADDKKFMKDIYIAHENSKGAVSGHKVVVEITDFGDETRKPEGKIVEILGHVNDPGVDILSVIRRYELPVEFPEGVYQEIESIAAQVPDEDKAGREDLRTTLTITIDGEDARDLDDAVSIERLENGNYLLGVHIADVSHYVPEGSQMDEEAYQRGTSVYLVDRVIPMLPHKLSNGICSLNPNTDRLAMSCLMEINEKGDVVDHKLCESVIHSDYRMTYTDVKGILEDRNPKLFEKYMEIIPMLLKMDRLRQILHEKRRSRGAINFDLPESKIILDAQGKAVDIIPYERNVATSLIEEFMLVCNETVAENAFWQEIPFMYRSHMEPDESKLERMEQFVQGFGYYFRKKDGEIHPREIQRVLREAEGTEQERIITRVILRSMMQARYSADNMGHFGLAAQYYCHFTSPIRRYPDLCIHRMLKKMLHGQMREGLEEKYRRKMPDWAKHCSKRERIAEDAERDTDQLKKVEYMADKIGQVYEGIISGVTGWGIYVDLPNTVGGMVALAMLSDDYYEFDEKHMLVCGRQTGKQYRLGDKAAVVVARVSKEMGTIDFLFAEESADEQKKRVKKQA